MEMGGVKNCTAASQPRLPITTSIHIYSDLENRKQLMAQHYVNNFGCSVKGSVTALCNVELHHDILSLQLYRGK